MRRLSSLAVPLLVAGGLLAHQSSRGQLDGEAAVGIGVFLVVAAVAGAVGHRLSRKRGA
jgi:hypothetical protein